MGNIRIERLMADIEQYARIGRSPEGGITRPCFSEADNRVRERFADTLREEGLSVEVDAAANVWGRLHGTGRKSGSLVVGSHLDTVPNGGAYDGALGVLMALELIRAIRDNGIGLDHDLDIVSFTGEEPNDFRISTMGSRCFTGRLTPDLLESVEDSDGKSLAAAMEAAGGGLARFPEMWRKREGKKAFLELHIEQGKRLERRNAPVAVVDSIVGIHREQIAVTGSPNHAGTTMMDEREDALMAASEMGLVVEETCRTRDGDSVGTIGRLQVYPNAANIIPGRVEFVLDLRDEQWECIQDMRTRIHEEWAAISRRRAVSVNSEVILDQRPERLDPDIVGLLERAVSGRGMPAITLPSMAGHDASHMASIARTAMIFVRSIDGKSHCPEEYSEANDIEVAGNVMLDALCLMDRTL